MHVHISQWFIEKGRAILTIGTFVYTGYNEISFSGRIVIFYLNNVEAGWACLAAKEIILVCIFRIFFCMETGVFTKVSKMIQNRIVKGFNAFALKALLKDFLWWVAREK